MTREFRVEREKNLKSAYLSACRFRQIARVLACGIKLREELEDEVTADIPSSSFFFIF